MRIAKERPARTYDWLRPCTITRSERLHYFREGLRSLCGRRVLRGAIASEGDRCATCERLLRRRRPANGNG